MVEHDLAAEKPLSIRRQAAQAESLGDAPRGICTKQFSKTEEGLSIWSPMTA